MLALFKSVLAHISRPQRIFLIRYMSIRLIGLVVLLADVNFLYFRESEYVLFFVILRRGSEALLRMVKEPPFFLDPGPIAHMGFYYFFQI